MNTISTALAYEIWILLVALASVVSYQLLTGGINMRGLLRDKMSGRALSPGRLQLLVSTVSGALYYLMLVFGNQEAGEFPPVPNEIILALAGSHAFYLGGKLQALLRQLFGLSSPQREQEPH